ncbi:glycosyltransferase family 4 protein [Actibacterium pelagium]|uniref:Glycoside hydrolase n=1 Tax=Actibacterium pelagium TaxID=2029103 RepID=A0A917EH93_9RHOB|nr:glycosyltransferase family 4 protein [Actibacterium pelagium]GGE39651.1 glycoside hydrolase [Actibacterium pelagium]
METYCLRLTEQLQKHCELDIIALPGEVNGESPSGGKLFFFGLRTAVRLALVRRKADVTHIADMASWPLGAIAVWSGKTRRVVLSAHGSDVRYALRNGWRCRLYRKYLGFCRRLLRDATFIANSKATADALDQLGFQQVCIIPLAAQSVEQAAPPNPKRYILFAGRILPQKGLSWFIEYVLPQLPHDISLRVAGTVWDKKEAACLEVDRVKHMGALDFEALQIAYRDALCVILPNLIADEGYVEGFGLAAPEASAAGAVVLAADSGGLKDAVIHGETGFLLPGEDEQAWADKIQAIAEWDTAKRDTFIEQSQQTCRIYFSWERVAQATLALYSKSGHRSQRLTAQTEN